MAATRRTKVRCLLLFLRYYVDCMRCPKMDRIFFFIKFVIFRTLKLFVRKVKYLVYFI